MGIRTKIMVLIASVLIVTTVSFIGMTTNDVKTTVQQSTQQEGEREVDRFSTLVDNYFSEYERDVAVYANLTEVLAFAEQKNNDITAKDIQNIFSHYVGVKDELFQLFMGLEDDTFVNYPADGLMEEPSYKPTEKMWYKEAIANPDQVIVGDAYPYHNNDKELLVPVSKAIVKNGKPIGVLALDLPLEKVNTMLNQFEIAYGGFVFVVDGKGTIVVHPTDQGENINKSAVLEQALASPTQHDKFTIDGATRHLYYNEVDNFRTGVVFMEKEMYKSLTQMQVKSLVIAGVILVISLLIALLFTRKLTRPLHQVMQQIEVIKEGDLSQEIVVDTKDDIGKLAVNFNEMLQKLRQSFVAIHQSSGQLAKESQELNRIAIENASTSDQVAKAISEVAEGAAEQAENIEAIQATTDTINQSFDHLNQSAHEMQTKSEQTIEVSLNGKTVIDDLQTQSNDTISSIQHTETRMTELTTLMRKIESITDVINAISEQTNLLALNASIEAARAGDAGKGFAVVAQEVRKLAEESHRSSNDIAQLILQVSHTLENTTKEMLHTKERIIAQSTGVTRTGEALKNIELNMSALNDDVHHLYAGIERLMGAQQEATYQITQIAAISQQSAAAAEEISASAEQQSSMVNQMQDVANQVREESETLDTTIRQFRV
ncbi:methyl-accepting chemotaxis protein McpC [Lysinibacillus alkalisoli]|uniref:Methyl-accepting chemotaxis protein McpC n=1 Tax=Lysinibacillus alkalisoli TaxID=1911548 RepID=A0A917GAC9_9BACI|nr:methyl-accepting chemotaxis protein [Lysinibacillus alkalisoli]GGG33481.1 methyl-accepting chemotaxis protein McpC [Lysinibacillus alkalisoli]